MRWVLACVAVAGLSACGADGEPLTPTRAATITLSDGGLAASGQLGLRQGPVSVTMGLGL